jgi:xanthine dehydrogenase YagS FAD-binding subunit
VDFQITLLHRLPGDEPQRDTTLERGELITSVEIPPLDFARRSMYRKLRDVRMGLGGVAHKPWPAVRAEAALRGLAANETSFRQAAAR